MKIKRIALIAISVAALLILSFLVGTGFQRRTDVVLVDYELSADGTTLTLRTSIPSSMGYIRGFEDQGGGVKPHYLTFYSTFGGLNSSFVAKHEFELPLGKDDTEVYFNRPGGGFELVLQKNPETGLWEWP